MRDSLRVSVVQMTSHNTHARNVEALIAAAKRAADEGAQMLALPEVAGLMDRDRAHSAAQITDEARDPYCLACREAAARHGLWIHTGSTPVTGPGDRYLNRTLLITPGGDIAARYDKIHLFDAMPEDGKPIGESKRYAPGARAVLVDSPFGPLGLSICYDLRFPGLYRDYALAGATVLFIPSAFTVPTGRAHWEVLLRARAIETGAYVIAAAQVGRHADGRQTWGHSLVVSPWGEVLADLGGEALGQITLDLPLGAVASARERIPSLRNGRDYALDHIRRG
ncbi:MAG: carbon-nitrogen hydrolase family protein [Pseudomonadota bacterium]